MDASDRLNDLKRELHDAFHELKDVIDEISRGALTDELDARWDTAERRLEAAQDALAGSMGKVRKSR